MEKRIYNSHSLLIHKLAQLHDEINYNYTDAQECLFIFKSLKEHGVRLRIDDELIDASLVNGISRRAIVDNIEDRLYRINEFRNLISEITKLDDYLYYNNKALPEFKECMYNGKNEYILINEQWRLPKWWFDTILNDFHIWENSNG